VDIRHHRQIENGFVLIVRTVLGFVFLWASYAKILDPGPFARAMANYQLVPEWGINLLALILVWVEFCCALLLLTGQWVRTSAFVVAGLLIVFIVAVSISLVRGLDVNCGCFSTTSGRKIGFMLLGEDALYLIMSLFLIYRGEDAFGWRAFLNKRMKQAG